MNQWQEETAPARSPSPVPPQTTPPASARPAPVPRAARARNAAGAQRRRGLRSLQDWTALVLETEELGKLQKKLKTGWRRCRGAPVSSGTASARCHPFAATAGDQERTTEGTQRWTRGGEMGKRARFYILFFKWSWTDGETGLFLRCPPHCLPVFARCLPADVSRPDVSACRCHESWLMSPPLGRVCFLLLLQAAVLPFSCCCTHTRCAHTRRLWDTHTHATPYSIQFICIAQFHKLQICLGVLYNLYT